MITTKIGKAERSDTRQGPPHVSIRIIYCHGLPGSTSELSAFGVPQAATHIHPLNRFSGGTGAYESDLLASFDALDLTEPTTVAGFSLGAMSAMRLAARRPHLVSKLVLISPAAPLQLGDFLADMAGRPVFEAARRGASSLRILSQLQATMASIAPRLVIRTMFQKSAEADRRLLESPAFLDMLVNALRASLGSYQAAYRAELLSYVRPWADVVDGVRCPVKIWQGGEDTWTPPAMASALKERIGTLASLELCPGQAHYSTLGAALPHLN